MAVTSGRLCGRLASAWAATYSRRLTTTGCQQSEYVDSYLDHLDRKRRSKRADPEFDTLGTWDTRLNLTLDEDSSIKTGRVIPSISLSMLGASTHQGRRSYQEDRYVTKELKQNLLYLAIFDGHGGTICADYCSQHFHRHILHWIERENNLKLVLEKCFEGINSAFDRWYKSKWELRGNNFSSGTTATVILVQDNYMIYVGHCGDCRAILCRNNKAQRLTREHCPSDPEEKKRIINEGGTVSSDKIGRNMVNNRLCMSRSIGDLELKEYGVVAVPDVSSLAIKHGKDQFLAITSDGINWVMQDQEVVDCINKGENASEGASRLVDQMASCGTRVSCHRPCSSLAFVPGHKLTRESDVEKLSKFVSLSRSLLVLTGAGISTESGIPDYRSEGVGLYATSNKRPIQHKTFMESVKARRSYWARNFIGWPRWSGFQPNRAHKTLTSWEPSGRLQGIVTQNVDQLHYKAGSRNVIELHGTNSAVICMNCSFYMSRMAFQKELQELNPAMMHRSADIRPDGDVELLEEEVQKFQVPSCPKCKTGILKPNVVFFGDNVPRPRVEQVKREVERCDSLLAIGTSLHVFSAYRIITQARDLKIPIAILNIGTTRADTFADVKIEAKAGDVLSRIVL